MYPSKTEKLEFLTMVKYANKELLEKLKKWAKTHKKSPSMHDINKDKSMPSVTAYVNHFGSFNKAKELAGLEIHRRIDKYSKEELLEKLKKWAKTHRKSPLARDIREDKSMPSVSTYEEHFGNFNKAKELAGLKITNKHTNEELLEKLKKWAKTHKKSPSSRDIGKDKSTPSISTYKKVFGSFNKAKELAGLSLFEYDSELNYVGNLLKDWKDGRKEELSEFTLKEYLRTLKHFEDFLIESGKTMQDMTVTDIKKYILEIKEMYAKGSIETKFNAIKNFLKFFLRKAIIEKLEPLFDLSMIEYINAFFKAILRQIEDDSKEDDALSEEEVETIKVRLKDYPLLDTLFRLDLNLGLRASEFIKIKVTQGLIRNRQQARKGDVWIDLTRGILMIYRKKSKRPHLVALTHEMVQLVKTQLILRKLYGVEHEFLFFTKTGKPLQRHTIFVYYQQISEIVGFKVTSHKVRRTMATMLEKRGVPHSIIKRRMGHVIKDITRKYQRIPIQERQQILEENVGIL